MPTLTESTITHPKKTRVLILGGGFGGIKAALELCDSSNLEATLLSDSTNFRYYPALYRTATGASPAVSSIPLAEIFEGKDIRVVKDSAKTLEREAKVIKATSGKSYHYDILIVALGVVTNFFGIKGLAENAFGIKTLEEAQRLRSHLHRQLLDDKKPDLHYVVIGGGPTGVELVGALPTYIRHIMKHHGLAERSLHIELVEAAPRLMPRMSVRYSARLQKRLRRLGIHLHLKQTVQAETHDNLMVSGQPIASHTVIWTAGVTNHPFLKDNKFALSEHGKATVNEFLQSEPDIYVIGDNADTPYSGMAQTALHDGKFIAAHLKKIAAAKNPVAYIPHKPVYVTPAGPRWAAVQWGKFSTFGIFGWLLRGGADFIGYRDYEPWWKASRHWIAEAETDESCPVCLAANKQPGL